MRKGLLVVICLAIILCTSCSFMLSGPDFYDPPDEYKDETIVEVPTTINSVQDGCEFAFGRMKEWAYVSKMRYILVSFVGEQIKTRKGIIEYQFTADNGTDDCLAEATVTVDMETNTSPLVYAWYDARTVGKRTNNGTLEGWDPIIALDTSKWEITVNEAFDIVYNTIGEDAFSRFENPNVTLVCFDEKWTFFVISETEKWPGVNEKHKMSIDPNNKEILEIKGFGEDLSL